MDIDELIVDRTRWRRCLRNCKEGIESDAFIQGRTRLVQLTRSIVTLASCGVKIPDFKAKAGSKSVDISAEIDNFFRAIVGRPAQPYRSIVIQKHVTPSQQLSAHTRIRSIVSPAKDAFHQLGDVLAARLLDLRRNANTNGNGSSNISSQDRYTENQIARIATGLIHVLMHLADCARYEEKPVRALAFAEFIRTLSPDNPEAHMRVALSLPLVSDGNTLRAFWHYCVFLANRGVPAHSPEARVVANAAARARQAAYTLARQATPPDKRELFAARFIAASWTILTGDLVAARKAAVKTGNAKLWASLIDLAVTDKKGAERKALEPLLIHAVGIAIFVRHRLSRNTDDNTNFDEKRAAAADAFLRNFASVLCDAVCANLDQVIANVRRRHKNRGRVRQRKRRKMKKQLESNNNVPQVLPIPQSQDELRLGAFEEVACMDMMPASLGALAVLCHFWSKTTLCVSSQQKKQFVALYRRLCSLGRHMDRLQEASGTTTYWARIRSTLVVHSEIPSLPEDVHLCNFSAARDAQLFKNRVHMKIPTNSFLKHNNDDGSGMLNRAVDKMGKRDTYESIVTPACGRHLDAFAQRMAKKVSSNPSGNSTDRQPKKKFLSSTTACTLLVMFVIRKQRIGRMTRYLETYQDGKIKDAANLEIEREKDELKQKNNTSKHETTEKEAIDTDTDIDVLETPEDDNESQEDSQNKILPGQMKRCARRNSSEDVDSAFCVRNMAKRRKVNGNTLNGNSTINSTTVSMQATQASHCSGTGTGSSGLSTVSPVAP